MFGFIVNYSLFRRFDLQIDKVRFEAHQLHESEIKRAMAGPTVGVNLDIPESIGLSAPAPAPSSSRLVDIDSARRRKRRI